MQILVAEDDLDEARLYKAVLESRGHRASITFDGRECLGAYVRAMKELQDAGRQPSEHEPYDVVILDYKMPELDGLEVAREIVKLNPEQRIIFASAFVKETVMNSVKNLKRVIEMIQKPFVPETLLELVEDTSTATKLQELDATAKEMSDNPSNDEIDKLLKILKGVQRPKTI